MLLTCLLIGCGQNATKEQAVPMAHKLVECGIKAIWNFAHVDLDVPNNIQVENVHLSDSLMKLSYNIDRYEKSL